MAKKKQHTSSASVSLADLQHIEQLGIELVEVRGKIKALEECKSEMSDNLTTIVTRLGAKKIEVGHIRATMKDFGSRSKLDEQKLLKAGVLASVIARCTVKSAPVLRVQVTELKERAESVVVVREERGTSAKSARRRAS